MLSFFKKNKDSPGKKMPIWLLIVGAVVGITLIVLGSSDSATGGQESDSPPIENEILHHQEYLETRIEELCTSMGMGEVSAIVTLAGGFEEIYATEWHGENEEYVVLGNASSAKPLLLSKNAPEIMGIGVVCRTAVSATRQEELLLLLATTFHVPCNRIYIAYSN